MIKRLALAALAAVMLCAPADAQSNRTTINASATITTGNTFQTIRQSEPRWSLEIQNNNTNGDNCWIEYGVGVTAGTATKANSILLQPGGSITRYFPYVPSDEIEATCASSSDTIYVDIQ